MKIGVLTSSRADYGIYQPLLNLLRDDPFFDMTILAFGTHLSGKHGRTVEAIRADRHPKIIETDTLPGNDSPGAIAAAMGNTMTAFSKVWETHSFDLIIALGDRYEMFAACASAVPFGIPIAHIHGGETTEGAIDDAFRHSITQMASVHFTTTQPYRNRVIALKGSDKHIYNTGALSIDNLKHLQLLSVAEMHERFNIDLARPSILITFHPETVGYEKNGQYTDELIAALSTITGYQFIITMPNTDTMGNMIREKLHRFIAGHPDATGTESFGALGYLSCMKHCSFLLGNTSSGFVEAAFFPKWVINLGDRQKGRILTPNIIQTPITQAAILHAVNTIKTAAPLPPVDLYGDGQAAQRIADILKHYL
jgi:GDP/UDP-N,N'-diacetylbacillosamine 2-epimerase (hydrolysing)